MPTAALTTARVEELRARLTRLFHTATTPLSVSPTMLSSGWGALDALLGGGLATGRSASIEGAAGAGTLALATSWARAAAASGEPVAVIDAEGSTSPHAWVAAGGEHGTWVVVPRRPAEAWAAADIALRSDAFGLVIVLDGGRAPLAAGARMRRLVRDVSSRLLLVGGAAPFTPDLRIALEAGEVEWMCAPIGDVPCGRRISVRLFDPRSQGGDVSALSASSTVEVWREDVETDRLRLRARAPDRRPSSAREGSARREAGPSPVGNAAQRSPARRVRKTA